MTKTSNISLKSIVEEEFKAMEAASGSGAKPKKLKKVEQVLGSNRHGLKRRRIKEKRQRQRQSAPKPNIFISGFPDPEDANRDANAVEKNVEKLMRLSAFSGTKMAGNDTVRKLVDAARTSKRTYEPKEVIKATKAKKTKPDPDDSTVFTEEDFAAFAKEMKFANSGLINRSNLEKKKKETAFV